MARDIMLTTVDNPFNPFEEFDKWYNYDISKGYDTCGLVARLTQTSSEFPEENTVTDSRSFGADYEVLASDIAETFEEVNADALTEALNTMKNYCAELGVDINSQDSFRVLTVGGFSNLYSVEHICRESFDSSSGLIDSRFDTEMRKGNRTATAIANGAAIIADGRVKVDYLCQTDIGFYYYDISSKDEKLKIVISKGDHVLDCLEPIFTNLTLYNTNIGNYAKIKLFLNDGSGKLTFYIDKPFKALCPDSENEDNCYQIGFSMNRCRMPMLHIRDKNGKENVYSLNSITKIFEV